MKYLHVENAADIFRWVRDVQETQDDIAWWKNYDNQMIFRYLSEQPNHEATRADLVRFMVPRYYKPEAWEKLFKKACSLLVVRYKWIEVIQEPKISVSIPIEEDNEWIFHLDKHTDNLLKRIKGSKAARDLLKSRCVIYTLEQLAMACDVEPKIFERDFDRLNRLLGLNLSDIDYSTIGCYFLARACKFKRIQSGRECWP